MSDNSEKFLKLVSKREEVCSKPINEDEFWKWLAEIEYCLNSFGPFNKTIWKIKVFIQQIYLFKNLDDATLSQLKAKLAVFENFKNF